jgi:uncharacterized protein
MTPVFADTFYYLALLNADDSAHDAAKVISLSLEGPVITTTWVLTEVADAAASARRRLLFLAMYEAISKDPEVTIVPPTWSLFETGVAFYARHQDKGWSLTDCISFLVMEEHRIQDALTADRHFEQAGFRALLR